MSTSYSNTGGTGNRPYITVTSTVTTGGGTIGTLLDGSIGNGYFFANAQAVSGLVVMFSFVTLSGGTQSVVIDEAKWYQNNTGSHGTWKWQGSNNGTTWTDIGSSFTLGGATPFQTQTTLNGNTTAYGYYRLLGVSGTTNSSPFEQEVEFKIDGLIIALTASKVARITNSDVGAKHQRVKAPATNIQTAGFYTPTPVPTDLLNGTTGIAYSEVITGHGGTSPYTFAIVSGSLPTGLTLASGGTISGTPTVVGTYTFTIRLIDVNGQTGSQGYTITVAAPVAQNYGYTA